MKKQALCITAIAILGIAGLLVLVLRSKESELSITENQLTGLNIARTKVQTQAGSCPSVVVKIGTYKNTDDLKQVAFALLRERNPKITVQDLELDTVPFMNFSTNPPTPAKGEILRTLLRPDGSIEHRYIESSQTTLVKIGPSFYNRLNRIGTELNCVGYRPIDSTCIGPLEFTKGDVLLEVAYAC